MNKTYIGVSGLARSGKNLFCDIAINILKEKYGLKGKQYALAYYLKKDCEQFVKDKLKLNVFSENTGEKSQFRELLVWYADIKRKQTQGRYWVDLLNNDITKDKDSDVIFISDIRYISYPKDEVWWIKNELTNGKLIHVKKYTYGFRNDGRHTIVKKKPLEKIYDVAPNTHEQINDPKIEKIADYKIEWEDIAGIDKAFDKESLLKHPYLNKIVLDCLATIMI